MLEIPLRRRAVQGFERGVAAGPIALQIIDAMDIDIAVDEAALPGCDDFTFAFRLDEKARFQHGIALRLRQTARRSKAVIRCVMCLVGTRS